MAEVKREYEFKGNVKYFDAIVARGWKASTYAASERKAKSNLIYQYKFQYGLATNAKISLDGQLKVM